MTVYDVLIVLGDLAPLMVVIISVSVVLAVVDRVVSGIRGAVHSAGGDNGVQ